MLLSQVLITRRVPKWEQLCNPNDSSRLELGRGTGYVGREPAEISRNGTLLRLRLDKSLISGDLRHSFHLGTDISPFPNGNRRSPGSFPRLIRPLLTMKRCQTSQEP